MLSDVAGSASAAASVFAFAAFFAGLVAVSEARADSAVESSDGGAAFLALAYVALVAVFLAAAFFVAFLGA